MRAYPTIAARAAVSLLVEFGCRPVSHQSSLSNVPCTFNTAPAIVAGPSPCEEVAPRRKHMPTRRTHLHDTSARLSLGLIYACRVVRRLAIPEMGVVCPTYASQVGGTCRVDKRATHKWRTNRGPYTQATIISTRTRQDSKRVLA